MTQPDDAVVVVVTFLTVGCLVAAVFSAVVEYLMWRDRERLRQHTNRRQSNGQEHRQSR